MSNGQSGNRFGEIAVRERLASRQAVQECLDIQGKLKSFGVEPKRVGEILVEKGYLREEDVKRILDIQRMGGSRMESRSGVVSDAGARVAAHMKRSGTNAATTKGVGGSPATAVTKEALPAVRAIPGYEVLELLGEGGMGLVYKARQKSLDRIVALKVLPPQAAKEASFIKRFISEARTVARLNHENIVAGIDVGEADGTYYFAMEHVEGESVAGMIERQGVIDERTALQIGAQIARALAHAHKHGLVHRDVKPQNILVTKSGLAKLCDLGLAKLQSEGSKDPTGVPVGTPHYLSPEQARGEADVDIRSDVYSLGASLFHMLTGETPFDGQSPMVLMTKHLTEEPDAPRKRNAEVSKAASDLVLHMMEKDKEDRPQTPVEVLEEIERVLSGKKSTSSAGRTSGRRKRKSTTSRALGDSQDGGGSSTRTRTVRPRMRFVRGGGSSGIGVVVILLAIIGMVAGAVFVARRQNQQQQPPPPRPPQPVDPEVLADRAYRQAKSHQVSDPKGARAEYEDILRRWPGSQAASAAKEAIEVLDALPDDDPPPPPRRE